MNNKTHKDITIHISPQSVLMIVGILALAALAYTLQNLLLVLFAAVVIAAAIEPAVKWLRRYGIPRLPAVISIYVVLAGALVLIVVFLIRPLIGQAIEFLNSLPSYLQSLQAWGSTQQGIGRELFALDGPDGVTQSISVRDMAEELRKILSGISGGALSFISLVFGGVTSFVLIVVLSFYLSVRENGVGEFLRLITPVRYEQYILGLWGRAERKIGYWMQGQLILVVIIGVITYIGLLLLGVEHALLLAFLAGIFELIPLFGPVLAAIPAVGVGFIGGGLTLALIVVGFYLLVQQLENHVIYPIVVKKVIGLSPVVIIIALIAGSQLAGFLGILLSVPAAAILMEFLNDVQERRPKQQAVSSEGGSTQT